MGMEKESAYTVVESAEDALGTTVLLGGVGAGEAEDGAVGCEKSAKGGVVELFPVVGLEGEDGATKLGGHIGVKRG